jgi:hypothetical protein
VEYVDHVVPKVVRRIAGEPFCLELREGRVVLSHARWSLMGEGGTPLEAERNLIEEARDIARVLLGQPARSLSPDAAALRDYVIRLR